MAAGLGAAEVQTAWDIYLFCRSGIQWTEAPPALAHWAHQLADSSWAGPGRHRTGEDLISELYRIAKEVTDWRP
jgi:hypothetical protein